jgi:MFS family permease
MIMLFVEPVRKDEALAAASEPTAGLSAWALMGHPRLRAVTVCALLLGLPTISDSFLFLSLQSNLQSAATAFPLFYVGTSVSTALFAVPAGRAADLLGRIKVLLFGYSFLALAYVATFGPGSLWTAALCLMLLGAYYAATDGVLTAIAAAELPSSVRGSGLAILATVTNVARLVASVVFGALWSTIGMRGATWIYFAVLIVAIGASSVLLTTAWRHTLSPNSVDISR